MVVCGLGTTRFCCHQLGVLFNPRKRQDNHLLNYPVRWVVKEELEIPEVFASTLTFNSRFNIRTKIISRVPINPLRISHKGCTAKMVSTLEVLPLGTPQHLEGNSQGHWMLWMPGTAPPTWVFLRSLPWPLASTESSTGSFTWSGSCHYLNL